MHATLTLMSVSGSHLFRYRCFEYLNVQLLTLKPLEKDERKLLNEEKVQVCEDIQCKDMEFWTENFSFNH